MLSSHSVVSSSGTVKPCGPWGGWWIGHWRTTWSTVCSSAPHSQAAEEAIPHLHKHKQKRLTPVRRWLSPTRALLGRVAPRRSPVSAMKMWSLVELSVYSAFHWWSVQCAARMLLLSEELIWWVVVRQVQMGVSIWGALHLHRRWSRSRSVGVDSGQSLHFRLEQEPESVF